MRPVRREGATPLIGTTVDLIERVPAVDTVSGHHGQREQVGAGERQTPEPFAEGNADLDQRIALK